MKLDITTIDNNNQIGHRQENLKWLYSFLRDHLAQGKTITIEIPDSGRLIVSKPISRNLEKASQELSEELNRAGYGYEK